MPHLTIIDTTSFSACRRRLLIDTAEEGHPEYFSNLRSALDERGVQLCSVLLTHWHRDHVGGVKEVIKSIAPVCHVDLRIRVWDSMRDVCTT